MFTEKKSTLLSPAAKVKPFSTTSGFISAAEEFSAETVSGNNAKKYSTTGDPFVDAFGKVSTYRAIRSFAEIAQDCELLWAEDKENCVKFIMYLRTIPRKVKFLNGQVTELVQKGAELKHESIMRMIWLSKKSPETFWKNLYLFVSAGSWKDIFKMLQYDLMFHGWEGRILDWEKFGNFIVSGLANEEVCNLIKKYLPHIRAASATKTVESQANSSIGKWLCSLIFGRKDSVVGNYKKYRQLKNSGTAHDWQKLISQRKFDLIDFDKVHGRALNKLVRSKFLTNQGLKEKYEAWVKSPERKEVKYTGFACELFQGLPKSRVALEDHVAETINKQFETLLNQGRPENACSYLVAMDVSGSMAFNATGMNISSFDVAKCMALYFSEFLTGTFKDSFAVFDHVTELRKWKGDSPIDKWYNDQGEADGSTNFQGVIDVFCRVKQTGVHESEFPTGILCISDGEFNPGQLGKTNVEIAKGKLRNAGFSEDFVDNFVIVLWNIPNRFYSRRQEVKFETFGDVRNVFYMSGYTASNVSFLVDGKIFTARDLFDEAMNQELLNMVEIS